MKTIKKALKSKKGFTLIELVVVIAVLGMIAVVAIPKIGGITKDAKDASDKQTIAVLNEAVERYKAETGEEVEGTTAAEVADFLEDNDMIKAGSYKVDNKKLVLPSGDEAKFSDGVFSE